MNPAHAYPTLHILPKPSRISNTKTQIIRHLAPQQGIIWAMVAPIFIRNGWQIQAQTNLFIKVSHLQSEQMVIISKMGQGQILINYNCKTFGTSELHEVENLAEIQKQQPRNSVKYSRVSNFLTSMMLLMLSFIR
jgi:hypothetical protein